MTLDRPDVVVGAGGYVSVPVGIAAKILGCKLLIHQQDVTPSLSNRLLAWAADAVTCAFDVSLRDFPARKTEVVGNPVRPIFERGDRAAGLKALGFSGERPIVMAVGGGTGSRFMNELITLASPLWTDFCDLVHVTGLDKTPVRPPTLEHPERYRMVEFVGEDIAHYFAAADIVITRAGLGTLTELAALSKPIIIIPLAGTQQETNAAYVVERGGARMFRELDLTPEQLVTFTRELLQKPEDMKRLGETLHGLFSGQARAALADRISQLALGQKKS
jgi:UDP-N-acetylglucosamine--N-acetylmuramyl-(pentapeptide) pyrophosphoryl-undecaprenol N-acetylglucosamine transferase